MRTRFTSPPNSPAKSRAPWRPDFARLAERTGAPTYVLVLPGPAGTRVPYDEPEGSPLWVLGDGISRLGSAVRESSHVH
ncbi:hypothetical protein [Streptomyces tendae]